MKDMVAQGGADDPAWFKDWGITILIAFGIAIALAVEIWRAGHPVPAAWRMVMGLPRAKAKKTRETQQFAQRREAAASAESQVAAFRLLGVVDPGRG